MFTDGCDPGNTENGSNRTGSYAVKVKLTKKIPNLIPIMGKRVKISYQGIQRLCTNCFGNHAKQNCQSKKVMWHQYVARFKESNPEFPRNLLPRGGIPRSEVVINDSEPPNPRGAPINSDVNGAYATSRACTSAEGDTAAWVESLSNVAMDSTMDCDMGSSPSLLALPSVQTSQPTVTRLNTKNGPQETDFKLPASEEEFNEIISNLMNAGSSNNEAERIIGMRRAAYNRACREYRKANSSTHAAKPTNKKPAKNSKHDSMNAALPNHD